MTWSELAAELAVHGAPRLGSALAGPLGEAAGRLLAEILAVPAPTPENVKAALPGAEPAIFADADRQWADLLRAEMEAQRGAVAETQATIRAELVSDDPLQRWWRPAYALELMAECAALWAVIVHDLWGGRVTTLNALIGGTALLVAYWGFRFGVLGVYVSGRTREKLAATTGELSPGVLEQLIAALRRKR
jgi:hypothetical protein